MARINGNIDVYYNDETEEFELRHTGRLDPDIVLTKDDAEQLADYLLNELKR